jgi:predicted RNA binding protein YcfA (HicA-like mRNA interferase family)
MGKVYSSRDLIRLIEADGWFLVKVSGDHHQFKHRVKPGRVTVDHPVKDVPKGTAHSVLKQAGLR